MLIDYSTEGNERIKRVREYSKQVYANTLDNLDEMDTNY